MATDDYFGGYAHTDIHAEMISDSARTRAYRRAIMESPELFEGKVVLDVGCGTGILSMFAAQAGARKVYAVEASAMAPFAKQIIEDNGLDDVIEVLHGKLEDLEVPEKVDVIISEWMGYALLFEGMVKSVLIARDTWLKPNGALIPRRARLYACAVEDFEIEAKRFAWWDSVYGFDMSALGTHCRTEPLVDFVDPHAVCTNSVKLLELDIHKMSEDDLSQSTKVKLRAERTETVHAILLWFDVDLTDEFALSTSPFEDGTHWKQTLLYLPKPIEVRRNDTLFLEFSVAHVPDRPRSIDMVLRVEVGDQLRKCRYRM